MDQESGEGQPAEPPPDQTRPWQAPSGSGPAEQGPAQAPPPQYGQPQYPPPPQYGPPSQYGPPQYQPPGSAPPPGYAPTPGYGPPPGYGPTAQYGAAGGWSAPFVDKPGVIPLRPLAVGEILDGVFTTIRQNPKTLLGLSFVIVLVGQLGVLGLNLWAHGAGSGQRLGATFGGLAITQLVSAITTGVAVIVIGEAVLGTRISPADTLTRLEGRIWRLVGLGLLAGLLILLAFVLLIVPGIYVLVLFSFATPVFVLEKTAVTAALSRSAELVRGSWWRTLGIGFLGYLVGSILAGLIEIPFTLFALHSSGVFNTTASADVSTGGEFLLAAGRIVGGTISTPIIAGTFALMYIDRRMRREGLDLVLAQTARERQGRS
jgi:hypothetical protein